MPHLHPPARASTNAPWPLSWGAPRPHCDLSARAPSQASSAEVALPKDPSRLSALLPTHVLSRHKDQRSDGFSLSPAALGGGGGKVFSSAIPSQQPQALHWTQRLLHHQASLSLWPLGACSGAGSWFMPASPSPVCFLWAAALQLQPLGRSSLPSLPPSIPPSLPLSLPRPCLCQVPPLSQASEQPWRQEGHVKSFFTVLRRLGG